ncbi:hypothetical protein P9112_009955 [Eukaryota sp. TZLM1-RC]
MNNLPTTPDNNSHPSPNANTSMTFPDEASTILEYQGTPSFTATGNTMSVMVSCEFFPHVRAPKMERKIELHYNSPKDVCSTTLQPLFTWLFFRHLDENNVLLRTDSIVAFHFMSGNNKSSEPSVSAVAN